MARASHPINAIYGNETATNADAPDGPLVDSHPQCGRRHAQEERCRSYVQQVVNVVRGSDLQYDRADLIADS
jgi:hypothetical protein